MIVKYRNIEYNSCNSKSILYVNINKLFYRKYSCYSNDKVNCIKLNYNYIKYTSEEFCMYLKRDRLCHLSVEDDTLDLEWDKNDFYTNVLETDNNDGILEFI